MKRILIGLMMLGLIACSQKTEPTKEALRVYHITEAAGIDDDSFNRSAHQGVVSFQNTSDVIYTVLVSSDQTMLEANFRLALEEKPDLMIVAGFNFQSSVDKMGDSDVPVLFIDGASDAANVRSVVFDEQEAGRLAGQRAIQKATSDGIENPLFVVLIGQEVPATLAYTEGFIQGVDGAEVIVQVIGSWTDAAQAKTFVSILDRTRDVYAVFSLAGGATLGVVSYAKEKRLSDPSRPMWVIGADSDLSLGGNSGVVLTSAMKRVDLAVFRTLNDIRNGEFTSGVLEGVVGIAQ